MMTAAAKWMIAPLMPCEWEGHDLICVNMADVVCSSFEVVLPTINVSSNSLEVSKMWDWFPLVFFPLKVLVLGTGMFFAIKWHRDQEKKKNETSGP
ncbi:MULTISPECIES: hypothetical protein [unclassified Rhizobium]|uniref:hypothetical protein n=1 Tax=unclassified Rhizobium TaxID=2613769 RepID=UPI0011C433E3|nr:MULTISPECIES: hypothetical protein [unclassified Rhizobium]MBN8953455.1 hypothetical protein [Rhizobium tropici]